jgi:hypothetical protein
MVRSSWLSNWLAARWLTKSLAGHVGRVDEEELMDFEHREVPAMGAIARRS